MKRGSNRAKRHVLARVGIARSLSTRKYQRRIADHVHSLPMLDADDRRLVQDMQSHAVAHPSLEALAGRHLTTLREGLVRITDVLRVQPVSGQSVTRPSSDELMNEPFVWRWGLDNHLLDIAENYLQLPVWYYGANVRREIADGKPLGVRRWHRDIEDRQVLKILIWLSDVDDDAGPLAYIPLRETADRDRTLALCGRVCDRRANASDRQREAVENLSGTSFHCEHDRHRPPDASSNPSNSYRPLLRHLHVDHPPSTFVPTRSRC